MKLNIKQMFLNWIGGGKTIVPVRFLKSIDVIGEVPEQVQSDWNQTDNTKPDYIKNKPEISGGGSNVKVYDAVNDDGTGTFDLTLEDQINVYNDIIAGKVVYIKTVREQEGFDLIRYGMVVSANYHEASNDDPEDYPETYNIYVIGDNSIVKVSTSND